MRGGFFASDDSDAEHVVRVPVRRVPRAGDMRCPPGEALERGREQAANGEGAIFTERTRAQA